MTIPGPEPTWQASPDPVHSAFQLNTVAISADGSTVLTGTSEEYGASDAFAVYAYRFDQAGQGTLLWSDPLAQDAKDGVFWVSISADGAWGAAGGSYGQSAGGFLRIYSVNGFASGATAFEYKTSDRVNQVEVSADGSTVVACWADTVAVFTRGYGTFTLADTHQFTNGYVRCCGINASAEFIVAGGDLEASSADATGSPDVAGLAAVMTFDGTSFSNVDTLPVRDGVRRMCVSGAFVVASTRAGYVTMWFAVMGPAFSLAWQFSPTPSVGVIYALAIRQVGNAVLVACGGNTLGPAHGTGMVFLIDSTPAPDGSGFIPSLRWATPTTYPPNPATTIDAQGLYVTAADGEPLQDGTETKGNFYLFSTADGSQPWGAAYQTSLMNWGMAIAANGTACVGASDDGTLYYWGAPG